MARELTPAATLGAYGAGLAVIFVAALGIGSTVGPVGNDAPEHGGAHSTDTSHDRSGTDHSSDRSSGQDGQHSDGSHTASTEGEAR